MRIREETDIMTSLRTLCGYSIFVFFVLIGTNVRGVRGEVTFESDLENVMSREKFIREHEKRSESYLNSVLDNKNNEQNLKNELETLENSNQDVENSVDLEKTIQGDLNKLKTVENKVNKLVINEPSTKDDLEVNSELESKENQLKLLSKQVRVLLERRTEDLRSIEENVRKIVFKGPEVEELRDQLRSLRQELEEVRTGTTPTSTTSKNNQIKTKWLSDAILEVKTEISELQLALNSSLILQNHEAVESKMALYQADVKNLNLELAMSKKREAKFEAEMTVLREEFDIVRREWKETMTESRELKNMVKSLQQEWANAQTLILEKQPNLPPIEEKTMPKTNRHQRVLRAHLMYLQKSSKSLHKENYLLKNKISKLETEMEDFKNLVKNKNSNEDENFDRINGNEIQNFISTNKIKEVKSDFDETLQKQILNVTLEQEKIYKNMENITRQMVNSEKLHFSMLELLEDVEQLEFKVENTEPSLRKEISKIESQTNQNFADIAELRENQKNIIDSVKAISYSVSELQEKNVQDKEKMEKLVEHVKVLEKADGVQNTKLHNHILKDESSTLNLNATKSTIHLVEELKSFESEYKSIVNKLPKDCSNVDGQKGIYLISPGDGEPILAQCDDGWTTVQKRYDGSLDFNRNWNDYSNGFGSATGEHWLGNRNLHHLTKGNCSRLQINMKDIYGKYWQATYDDFRIADYTNGFRIYIGGYSGNSSDAMNYQNNMEFSTVDNDRDISNTHCASNYEGGWWFSHCQHANLNGRYNLGLTWFDGSRNEWIAVSHSEMRVKRRDVC